MGLRAWTFSFTRLSKHVCNTHEEMFFLRAEILGMLANHLAKRKWGTSILHNSPLHTQLVYIIREMSPVSRIIEWAHNSGQDLAFDLLFWSETLVLYNLHAHPKYSEIQTPFSSGPFQVVINFMLRGIYLFEKAMSTAEYSSLKTSLKLLFSAFCSVNSLLFFIFRNIHY